MTLLEIVVAVVLLLVMVYIPGAAGVIILAMMIYGLVRVGLYCRSHLHPSVWRMRKNGASAENNGSSENGTNSPPEKKI